MVNQILTVVKKHLKNDEDISLFLSVLQYPFYKYANVHNNNLLLETISNNERLELLLIRMVTEVFTCIDGANNYIHNYCNMVFHTHSTLGSTQYQEYTEDSLEEFLSSKQRTQQLLLIAAINLDEIKKYKG